VYTAHIWGNGKTRYLGHQEDYLDGTPTHGETKGTSYSEEKEDLKAAATSNERGVSKDRFPIPISLEKPLTGISRGRKKICRRGFYRTGGNERGMGTD